jgi:hypothetical protein
MVMLLEGSRIERPLSGGLHAQHPHYTDSKSSPHYRFWYLQETAPKGHSQGSWEQGIIWEYGCLGSRAHFEMPLEVTDIVHQ